MTSIVLATVSASVVFLAGYLLGRSANVARRVGVVLERELGRPAVPDDQSEGARHRAERERP